MLKTTRIIIFLMAISAQIYAEEPILLSSLNEKISMIKVDSTLLGGSVELETTIFKPPGDGPFPLVVINHGMNSNSNPKYQPRSRFTVIAEEFVMRGYVVAIPNARGFSKSDGSYGSMNCKILQGAEEAGKDIRAVISSLKMLPYIDNEKIIVAGDSYGGINALATITETVPGIKLALNFAGGLKFDTCNWESAMEKTFSELGKKSKAKSIWFYGNNDNLFTPELVKKIYAAYNKDNSAELVQYGDFRNDSHGMFATQDGFNKIWWPKIQSVLKEHGFPIDIKYPQLRFDVKAQESGYAKVDDIGKIPSFVKSGCIPIYLDMLKYELKTWAIAFSNEGSCGFSLDTDIDPGFVAMQWCGNFSKSCKLYAVNNKVVWPLEK